MKQYLSLLLAMLIVCSAITVMPLSAAAEETGDTITVTADPPPNETRAPEDETIAPVESTDPIEEDPVDYPIITKFENQKSGVKITWDAYNNNTSYRVYYRKAAAALSTRLRRLHSARLILKSTFGIIGRERLNSKNLWKV